MGQPNSLPSKASVTGFALLNTSIASYPLPPEDDGAIDMTMNVTVEHQVDANDPSVRHVRVSLIVSSPEGYLYDIAVSSETIFRFDDGYTDEGVMAYYEQIGLPCALEMTRNAVNSITAQFANGSANIPVIRPPEIQKA